MPGATSPQHMKDVRVFFIAYRYLGIMPTSTLLCGLRAQIATNFNLFCLPFNPMRVSSPEHAKFVEVM